MHRILIALAPLVIAAGTTVSVASADPDPALASDDVGQPAAALDEEGGDGEDGGLNPPPQNMFANNSSAMDDVCNDLGGYYATWTDRCIMKGFRIGAGPQTNWIDCNTDGGEWSSTTSTCWFSSKPPPPFFIDYSTTYKITVPGITVVNQACLAGPHENTICNLVNGDLEYEPTVCGTAQPYLCTYTQGRLSFNEMYFNGGEQADCGNIGGLYAFGTPPGALPRCWTRGWLPATAPLASSESSACIGQNYSYNHITNRCWHRAPFPLFVLEQ